MQERKKRQDEKKHKSYEKKESELLWNCIKIPISELLRLPDNGSNNIIFEVCIS